MNKKVFIAISILLSIIFSFSMVFANNVMQDAVDGVRNVVGGAENAIEGAVRDMSNASKNATGQMQNTANEVTNTMTDDRNDDGTNITTTTNTENNTNNSNATNNTTNTSLINNNNGGYTATRTGLTDDTTFMGMGATAWTWLILGIAAIAIVALVWYYSMQITSSNTHRD